MNPNIAKALANSAKRPVKTSKLNPYVMRKTDYGEIRTSPRLSALKASLPPGSRKAWPEAIRGLAEVKADYQTDRVSARSTAADMARRYRKTKQFSAQTPLPMKTITRLVSLNAKLDRAIEFADNDHLVRRLILGNSISAGIAAPKGKKFRAYGESEGNVLQKSLHDGAIGAGAGLVAGLASRRPGGAKLGTLVGAGLGSTVGLFRGHYGKEAKEIHDKYSKARR